MDNNNNFKNIVQGLLSKAALANAPVILTAIGYILLALICLFIIMFVIFAVIFGVNDFVDTAYETSGDLGERVGNLASLQGFKTNTEVEQDEEAKFVKMLDYYQDKYGFSNAEINVITKTLLYEGAYDEMNYLSGEGKDDDTELDLTDEESIFETIKNFVYNVLNKYQMGLATSFAGESQYEKANKNLMHIAFAMKKCKKLTGNSNSEKNTYISAEEELCFEGYLNARYDAADEILVAADKIDYGIKPGYLVASKYAVLMSEIIDNYKRGNDLLEDLELSFLSKIAPTSLAISSMMDMGTPGLFPFFTLANLNVFISERVAVELVQFFVDNFFALQINFFGKLADGNTKNYYYDGYIVDNLKERYRLGKSDETRDSIFQSMENIASSLGFNILDKLLKIFDLDFAEKARQTIVAKYEKYIPLIESEIYNMHKIADDMIETTASFYELAYGKNNAYDTLNNKVLASNESNALVGLTIDGMEISLSFDNYVLLNLINIYGSDIDISNSELVKALAVDARTKGYLNLDSNIGLMKTSSANLSDAYEKLGELSADEKSVLISAIRATTGKVIRNSDGSYNGTINIDIDNFNGNTMEDIIGNLGGSIKSSGIASPFPYLENLRPIISSGYESIDSAHATEHGGTDLAVGQGTSVYSASSGKVIASYNNCGYGSLGSKCGPTGYGGYGNIVVVESYDDNGKPYYVYYAHMEAGSVGVNVGDTIETGTYLGGVGSSGSSTGYHLHFEVRQGANDKNYQVNPLAFFGLN